MIVTVTANPALDVTYRVDTVRPGQVHRVADVTERAGGKGINVARVLHALAQEVVATGVGGGLTGARVVRELAAEGIRADLVRALPDVRRTLVVQADDGSTTSFWEPGHRPASPEVAARQLVDRVHSLLRAGAAGLVVSGSLAPGLPASLPAKLAELGAAAGVPAVVDADGEPLHLAAHGGHAVLTPNREELGRLDGGPVGSVAEVAAAAARVRAGGARAVVATLGADGMLASTPDGTWVARPVEALRGNPTGAGDAAAAAVVLGLAAGADWPSLLRDAVALSAAAVARPVAGEVDRDLYRRWRERVPVERWEGP
ncbi:MAG: 1-phosphofructokinase family hexose kinase [Actinomycetota bacterium]